jgi:hypothetical protein
VISFYCNAGGSGLARGHQVAQRLGAYINPDVPKGTCIWVKKQPPEGYPPGSWLDVVDAKERVPWLRQHTDVGAIACSWSGHKFLRERLGFGRRIRRIPHHHANFERASKPPPSPPFRLGVVGGSASVPPFWNVRQYHPRTREAVLEAYQEIDVQLVWRTETHPLKSALKIVNAASFGIPTIAYPASAYGEAAGVYYPALTEGDAELQLRRLADGWDARALMDFAEAFHIDRIIEEYQTL